MIKNNLVVLACTLFLSVGALAEEGQYRIKGSSLSVGSAGVDTNGDMQGGFVADDAGVGTFGRYTQQTVGDAVVNGAGTLCDPGELELSYASLTSTLRTQSGDLLYRRLTGNSDSRVCLNFAKESGDFKIHYDIVGGTGRFRDATGSAVQKGTIKFLGAQNAGTFVEKGRIHLRHK